MFNGEKYAANLNLEKFLTAGCITGVLRGWDSTGVYQVLDNRAVRVHKKPMTGFDFAQLKATQALFGEAHKHQATVVHHRAATHGTVNAENCHPFEHENDSTYLVGVHNGTINTFSKKEDGLTFDVDSDWLYYQILKCGAPKALGALSEWSAYALVWYDQAKNKHYIAANKKRPIHWGFVKDKNIMLFASESAHLYWLASRYDLKFEAEIWSPAEDVIFEFDADDLRKYKTYKVEREIKPVIPPVQNRGRWNHETNAWDDARNWPATTTSNPLSRDTDKHRITVDYIEASLRTAGIDKDKNYKFWPEVDSLRGQTGDQRVCTGLLVNVDNEDDFHEAAALLYNSNKIDQLMECDFAEARPYAVRYLVDKGSATRHTEIVVSLTNFHRITEDGAKQLVVVPSVPVTKGEAETEGKGDTFCKGPRGRNLTEAQFIELTKNGCINCSKEIKVLDNDFVSWVNNGTDPCCADCTEDLAQVVH